MYVKMMTRENKEYLLDGINLIACGVYEKLEPIL